MAPVKGNGRRTRTQSAVPAASVECFFTNSQTQYRKLAYSETRIWKLPLEYDSRRVRPGQLFFAIRGMKADGTTFIPEAVARGAVAVVSEAPPESVSGIAPAAWVQAPDARIAMALASDRFFDHPSRQLKLLGVTGTNGKTTVAYLLASILKAAGWKPGLFGTIKYQLEYGERAESAPAPNTTPESLDLQRMLRQVADHGGRSAVMEVSSHALALDRVAGCAFHAAVFTQFFAGSPGPPPGSR